MNCYIYVGTQTQGPIHIDQLAQMLETGQISRDTVCCREGDSQWSTVSQVLLEKAKAASSAAPGEPLGPFHHVHYTLRKKFWKFFGQSFRIFGPKEELVLFSKMKAFKLKEDIRVYSDLQQQTELLSIMARQIFDLRGTFDVYDTSANIKIGALKRKGLSSIVGRDEWIILNAYDQEIGSIREDSLLFGLIRRYLPLGEFIPQQFDLHVGGVPVGSFQQNLNFFIPKIAIDFSKDTQGLLDRRLGLAAAVLLAAIEGRQK